MFLVWIFIIAIVAILVVYLVSNKSCCCGDAKDSGSPAPKTEPPKVAAPAPAETTPPPAPTPPAEPKTTGGEKPAER
ncbi:MAG: hypothetical protein P9M08_13470 [Candidatus Erginobacter occultus]|nr:hypothetical protein [Candidatus Erginobacter occultus]